MTEASAMAINNQPTRNPVAMVKAEVREIKTEIDELSSMNNAKLITINSDDDHKDSDRSLDTRSRNDNPSLSSKTRSKMSEIKSEIDELSTTNNNELSSANNDDDDDDVNSDRSSDASWQSSDNNSPSSSRTRNKVGRKQKMPKKAKTLAGNFISNKNAVSSRTRSQVSEVNNKLNLPNNTELSSANSDDDENYDGSSHTSCSSSNDSRSSSSNTKNKKAMICAKCGDSVSQKAGTVNARIRCLHRHIVSKHLYDMQHKMMTKCGICDWESTNYHASLFHVNLHFSTAHPNVPRESYKYTTNLKETTRELFSICGQYFPSFVKTQKREWSSRFGRRLTTEVECAACKKNVRNRIDHVLEHIVVAHRSSMSTKLVVSCRLCGDDWQYNKSYRHFASYFVRHMHSEHGRRVKIVDNSHPDMLSNHREVGANARKIANAIFGCQVVAPTVSSNMEKGAKGGKLTNEKNACSS